MRDIKIDLEQDIRLAIKNRQYEDLLMLFRSYEILMNLNVKYVAAGLDLLT